MILEGIVTTMSLEGQVNIAPMGLIVDEGMDRLLLRPFRTSQTYRNLKAHRQGVLHVTDDVLLLAQAALNAVDPAPVLFPARMVQGMVLGDACRFFEFRVTACEDSQERTHIEAEVVHRETQRDFFGFNRAKHAVIEAAILATRTDFLPLDEVEAEFVRLAVLVHKTGGEREERALAFLQEHLNEARRKRSS